MCKKKLIVWKEKKKLDKPKEIEKANQGFWEFEFINPVLDQKSLGNGISGKIFENFTYLWFIQSYSKKLLRNLFKI